MGNDLSKSTFRGYVRENGRVGVRNHVIVLPVDDLSNAAAQAVENNIKGVMAIPHPYGRLQFGADLELHFRTLIDGLNPNVAAVVVIGIEDQWTSGSLTASRRPANRSSGLESSCTAITTRFTGVEGCARVLQWASELAREERPPKDLWVSTKCGESDTTSVAARTTVGNAFDKLYPHRVTLVFATTELTGGEHLVAARCRNDEVRKKFQFVRPLPGDHRPAQDERPSDSQPTKGNIAGGLTTIEARRSQHPEDRAQVRGRRSARQGRDADLTGLWSADYRVRGRRDGDAMRRRRLRGAFLPDWQGT
jgi:(2R)-sulfolactate sulfo-lyase subunit beta